MNAILEMKNIVKTFPGVLALNNVDISLLDGEILAIVGENGAGKSTLMKILSGSYPSSSFEGEIHISGSRKNFHTVKDSENAGIEMIYQEINSNLDLSIAENIYMGSLPVNRFGLIQWPKVFMNGDAALRLVGLDISSTEIIRNLSASQQQMVSIAKALVRNPKILVLDEPTSSLTEKETEILLKLLIDLKAKNISSIYISHKLNEVFSIADRITVMRDGSVVSTYEKASVDMERIVEDMVGRKIDKMFPKICASIGDEVLRVVNISVPHPYTKNKNILNNINFTLRKGEILGLAGLVGSGRSELLNAIFGSSRDGRTGDIFIEGKKVEINNPIEAKKMGLGLLTEDRRKNGYVGTMDITGNISLASLEKIFPIFFLRKDLEKKYANEYSSKLRIKAPSINTSILTLSGGNQQKVVIAKWLMMGVKVLFLDEPTRGIDVGAKVEIYNLMMELVQSGISIIMVSSELPELISMCDRFIILSDGIIQDECAQCDVSQVRIMNAAAGLNNKMYCD